MTTAFPPDPYEEDMTPLQKEELKGDVVVTICSLLGIAVPEGTLIKEVVLEDVKQGENVQEIENDEGAGEGDEGEDTNAENGGIEEN